MARSFEMRFVIGGNLDQSFSRSFSRATASMSDLRGQARQTQRALDQMGSDFRRGRITQSQYTESTARLTRELNRLEHAQQRIKTMKTMFSSGLDTAKNVVSIAALGTAAAATGLAFKSLNTAADFQQQMARVGAKAGASAADLKKLSSAAQQFAPLAGGAKNAAIAMDDLAAKGYSVNQIIQAMPGILSAANASGEDLALTSDTITSALETFRLKTSQTSHVADVLAQTSNLTAAGMTDLQYTFKYAAAPAEALGISMEQLAAMTGLMANSGIKGETSGTALREAMLRLVKPPKEAAKELKNLGVKVTDNHNKFRNFSDIIGDLNKRTAKMTNAQKTAALANIFGTNAVSGMLTIIQAGKPKIDQFTNSLEHSDGASKKAANAMMNNYGGSLKQLEGAWDSAKIKFATPLLPVFKDVFDGITSDLTKNMGGIENAGKSAAAGLREIFEPFTTKKPVFDPRIKLDPNASAQYQQKLDKFTSFNNMDFGDKVVYMLDEATKKMETWLGGSGGKTMGKIFNDLGTIAGKAWWNAFKGSIQNAGSDLMKGNVAGAGVNSYLAWILGGGVAVKGYKVYKTIKGRRTPAAAVEPEPTTTRTATAERTTPRGQIGRSGAGRRAVRTATTERTATEVRTAGTTAAESGGKGILKKALGPLGEFLTIKGILDLQDQVTDWAVGHKKGEAKSPGLLSNPFNVKAYYHPETYKDTRVGAIPKFFGFGGEEPKKQAVAATPPGQSEASVNINASQLTQATSSLVSQVNLSTKNFSFLTTYAGTASGQIYGSFSGIKTSADKVKFNLDLLVSYTGQASGWMASLNGIQSAGERVIKALNNLETRINNVKLPSKRVSYNG